MRRFVLLLVFSLCCSLMGCGTTLHESSDEIYTSIEHISLVDTTDFETLVQYSSNIVEAALVSTEEFSEGIIQYKFAVKTDYTSNTPEEIFLYDPYNAAYVLGHDYCLFMQGSENALYPHTIYSTVDKDLILDYTENLKCGELYRSTEEVSLPNIQEAIQEAISNGSVGAALPMSMKDQLMTAGSVGSSSDEADAIVKVRFSSEEKENLYVSSYCIAEAETIKGSGKSVSSYIFLEPDLQLDTDYYVFLKEDPAAPGTYFPLDAALSSQEFH